MRSLRFGLAVAVLSAGFVGFSGCAEDNNKNVTALPGGSSGAPPKSQKEYMESQKSKTGPSGYGSDYPGSKGGPPAGK